MKNHVRSKLIKLPEGPGVYFFLSKRRKILYIGRATTLRSRVRSYFRGDLLETRGPWVSTMLPEISGIDYRATDSVLEAILLEADLIKKFQPPYNTELKDDKSFNCIAITDEEFPRILLLRKSGLDSSRLRIKDKGLRIASAFGPFPRGFELKTALKIIRRIFPWRDEKCVPRAEQRGAKPKTPWRKHSNILQNVRVLCRPCFSRQIGLCPGVCTGEISSADYRKQIRRLCLFLSGHKRQILRELEREMKLCAKREEFERAGEIKRQLFALRHIQDVALLKRDLASASVPRSPSASVPRALRIEAYDLSHFGGKEIVGAMSVVEDGVAAPSEYRLFRIRDVAQAHEVAGFSEILRRRLAHPEWSLPQLIVVDGNEVQRQAALRALAAAGKEIPVLAVVKNERHRPREILGERVLANEHRAAILLAGSEAHRFVLKFQRQRRSIA